jgi:hypothetical protein
VRGSEATNQFFIVFEKDLTTSLFLLDLLRSIGKASPPAPIPFPFGLRPLFSFRGGESLADGG